jgi:alkaline phosphatase D
MLRRHFFEHAALATVASQTLWLPRSAWSQTRISSNPFSLGIASGSPTSDGVVLWTRLLPVGTGVSGRLGADTITVVWEIAHDEGFTRIVQSGQTQALAQLAHSVHVEVAGLDGGRGYFYRFTVGEWVSATGRTRTLPALDAPAGKFRMVYASCQRWEHGYYSAYRHMLADQPDLVLFLGDYIYEYPRSTNQVRAPNSTSNKGWTISLDDYRSRYALHKSDPDLQAIHAACPWAFTWDDHEVQNDYAGVNAGSGGPDADFAARRAAAYQAFYEHTPLRSSVLTRALTGLAEKAEIRLYSELSLGALGSLYLLDARQYKDDVVCTKNDTEGTSRVNPLQCPAWNDPARTMLGKTQEAWLTKALDRNARNPGWQIVGQPSLFGARDMRGRGRYSSFGNDGWDGYSAARTRITDAVQKNKVKNLVVLGGDVHENWVGQVKADYASNRSTNIGVEFCGTSITSRSNELSSQQLQERLNHNPHFIFADVEKRGYGLAEFSARKLQVSLRTVSDVTNKDATPQTLAQFEVASGKPVVERI